MMGLSSQLLSEGFQNMNPATVSFTSRVAPFFLLFVVGNCPILIQGQSDEEVTLHSSNIPIVIIDTQGQTIPDEPRIPAKMKVIDNADGERNYLLGEVFTYNGDIEIEIRGSTSQSYEKKQYRLETQHPDGSNNNVSLMGLPPENDWILGAPSMDKSLIRNSLAYHISREIGEYAPRTRPCELVLNGEYRGVYILTEKPKRDNNRLNLSEENGYILKIDKFTGYKCSEYLSTDLQGVDLQYDYPDCEELSPESQSYIEEYVNQFEEALYSKDFMDPEEGYRQYLDAESFANYFICTELSKDVDAYRLSTFLHKEDDSEKLRFGPVWDKNIAFGNADFWDGHTTSGLIGFRKDTDPFPGFMPNPWVVKLLSDSTLVDHIANRWVELRSGALSNERLSSMVDSLASDLAEAQERNFRKWPEYTRWVWPNFFVGSSYGEEIAFLKSWLINRANWLDNNITGTFNSFSRQEEEFESTIYPNPFAYFFTYAFHLQEEGSVSLQIVAPNGSKPGFIIQNQSFSAGNHKITWNSYLNEQLIPSTYYVLVLEVNGVVVDRSVVVKRL